mgnify:CR=1 FL=1
MLAPIVVFAYNRPNHLLRCLNSLLTNPESAESSLHVFVDGPKSDLDKEVVNQCVNIAQGIVGFKSLDVVVSDENLEKCIDVILDNASEGNVGDGKIFVYDVQDAIRIRTRTRGIEAIR